MIMVTNPDAYNYFNTNKLPLDVTERLRHLKYLNEFRTTQCPYFLDQQCHNHRPYTCFYWHFPNQKRRPPIKKSDGTFNYNPDVYCDRYDENSGSCPVGDECPYAHRNAGDTERRYHPRYFKTGNCIYETTETGACVKNGLHCAFAHGPDDLRLPVYDIREVQDASLSKVTINLPASLEKERVLSEDPTWNDMLHVMARYKTESCRKPPRMCRQGYSCPYYHNGKDKRRMPEQYFYRSTPCPAVRSADEWLDSALCDAGDSCTFCHTRTEQQFHPEIYKSTKCNDVMNSGYCPRGPFCAFAHADSEMTLGRTFLQSAAGQSSGLSASPPQHQDVSPISSSTSASSSGVFSPGIRPSVSALTPFHASHTFPTGGPKLRIRHRSGGTTGSADSGGLGANVFDLQEATPSPSAAAAAAAPSTQPSMLPYFPLFSPRIASFAPGALSMTTRTTVTTDVTDTNTTVAAAFIPQQGSVAKRKVSVEANKFAHMRLDSGGGFISSSSSSPLSLTNQQPTQRQHRRTGGLRSVGKCSPQSVTPSFSSSITSKGLLPWWVGAEISDNPLHHPDNEYLNSLVTDNLRTQLTVNTSSEELHHRQQLIKELTQSPLSCFLQQMQFPSQQRATGNIPTSTSIKRASGLFDDDPLGGVTASPLSSPQPITTLPPPSHQPSAPIATTTTTVTAFPGCSAPVCIPSNSGCRADAKTFNFPYSCGKPMATCEFSALGSTSLHSMTPEGRDSALAVSEAQDYAAPDLPPINDAFSSMLLNSAYNSRSLLSDYSVSTAALTMPVTEATNKADKTGTIQSPVPIPSSPFGTTASDIGRMILKQELDETICKLNVTLQDLESLRSECAEQKQQTLGLQVVVRQIVMILFNHLAEVRRSQEKQPPTSPLSATTTTTTPSSRDASLIFLNDLLRVLLCESTVRLALKSEDVPLMPAASATSTATAASLGVPNRPTSLRRKSCSNPPGSWNVSGVLEDLEEEDQLRMGPLEESAPFENNLRLSLSHQQDQPQQPRRQDRHELSAVYSFPRL